MRFQGKLTSWDDAKGIGTITWNGKSDRVFVHISAFTARHKRPAQGDIVTYAVERDKNGKFRAVNVSFPQNQLARARAKPDGIFIGLVFLIFSTYLLFAAFSGRLDFLVLGIYAVVSVVAFFVYWLDKNAAMRGEQRTPERTLHMLALCCGWPGAFLAQRAIKHKSTKASFQRVFVATVLLNIGGFSLYTSPSAWQTLRNFLG